MLRAITSFPFIHSKSVTLLLIIWLINNETSQSIHFFWFTRSLSFTLWLVPLVQLIRWAALYDDNYCLCSDCLMNPWIEFQVTVYVNWLSCAGIKCRQRVRQCSHNLSFFWPVRSWSKRNISLWLLLMMTTAVFTQMWKTLQLNC